MEDIRWILLSSQDTIMMLLRSYLKEHPDPTVIQKRTIRRAVDDIIKLENILNGYERWPEHLDTQQVRNLLKDYIVEED